MMVRLEIEIVLPPRSEQKVDTRKTNEAESKKKKKDEIQIEEGEASCKQQTNEAEGKERRKDEIQVEENEEAGLKQLEKMVMVSSDKKKPYKNGGGFENMMKDFSNINLLVSTIIATATFAAAFAMPGGYNDQGLPVLHGSRAFKDFLFWDQIAFFASAATLWLHSLFTLHKEIFAVTLFRDRWAGNLTSISLIAMVFAFDQGIKAVIPGSENHNFFKDTSALIFFLCFYVFVNFPCLALLELYKIARRFEPRNSVTSRFGLWS